MGSHLSKEGRRSRGGWIPTANLVVGVSRLIVTLVELLIRGHV